MVNRQETSVGARMCLLPKASFFGFVCMGAETNPMKILHTIMHSKMTGECMHPG